MKIRCRIGLLVLAGGCASSPAASTLSAPAPTSEWVVQNHTSAWEEARSHLALMRTQLVPTETRAYAISAIFREEHTGHTMSARGAVAVRPPNALRMQLVGATGALALDVWVDGDRARFAIPILGFVERSTNKGVEPFQDNKGVEPFQDNKGVEPFQDNKGVEPFQKNTRQERPGQPTAFLRWWMLHPLDGRLLFAAVSSTGTRRYVLRAPDGALLDAHVSASEDLFHITRRTRVDEERILAHTHPCGDATYESENPKLRVEVHCTGLLPEPNPRAFADPDGATP